MLRRVMAGSVGNLSHLHINVCVLCRLKSCVCVCCPCVCVCISSVCVCVCVVRVCVCCPCVCVYCPCVCARVVRVCVYIVRVYVCGALLMAVTTSLPFACLFNLSFFCPLLLAP